MVRQQQYHGNGDLQCWIPPVFTLTKLDHEGILTYLTLSFKAGKFEVFKNITKLRLSPKNKSPP